ncbi:hypothetical protein GCM10023171_29200 [Microbacterium panaciterrae]|uniref:Uncharacterized protein n=1 Tax=Microbacterium panaciterrae TaxID=985759 RepID=A0ABP8PMR2_9MICO
MRGREGVQLVQGGIADQVRPEPAVRGPDRIVHEYRHAEILDADEDRGSERGREPDTAALALRPASPSGKVAPWCTAPDVPLGRRGIMQLAPATAVPLLWRDARTVFP